VKNKTKKVISPAVGKSPEKLARLKALSERVHGKFRNFMTQEDLRKMREEDKWAAYEAKIKMKTP
jgi:hypothetical protein